MPIQKREREKERKKKKKKKKAVECTKMNLVWPNLSILLGQRV